MTDAAALARDPVAGRTGRAGSDAPAAGLQLEGRKIRHSRLHGPLVSSLKVLLPTLAIALIVLVVLWPILKRQNNAFTPDLISAERIGADNFQVLNPRYSSRGEGEQSFLITADSIKQKNMDDAQISLHLPKADILLGDDGWVAVTAGTGELNRDTQTLELRGGVSLFHDRGYEFRTEAATFDIPGQSAHGFDPVAGQGPFGFLEAGGFRIDDNGARVALTGRARIVIYTDRIATDQPQGDNPG